MQDNENSRPWPLAERARRGLLADESCLTIDEIAELEWPKEKDALDRALLKEEMEQALRFDELKTDEAMQAQWIADHDGWLPAPDWITRDSYPTWRARLPAGLLSPLSHIGQWVKVDTVETGEPWLPYTQVKACLQARDADLCGWTWNKKLRAYKKFNGRFHPFDWKDANPDFEWIVTLRALWFQAVDVAFFRPDPDLHYLTFSDAVDQVQRTLPTWSRKEVEDQLLKVACVDVNAKPPELNLDLVVTDPLSRVLSVEVARDCLFLSEQINEFVLDCGSDVKVCVLPAPDSGNKLALILNPPKRKRTDALREAIDAALAVLTINGGKSTSARLFEYLRTQDQTGIISREESTNKFLCWWDSEGTMRTATVRNLSDRLKRLKKVR